MKSTVTTSWKGDMTFESIVNGHSLVMDLAAEEGGSDLGPRPKPLLLAGLSGCSGLDVVSILKKMREPCTWFEMTAEADTRTEHPRKYAWIKLVYRFRKSDNLNHDNVLKACSLSQEKYCGVSAMLKDSVPLEWDIEYV